MRHTPQNHSSSSIPSMTLPNTAKVRERSTPRRTPTLEACFAISYDGSIIQEWAQRERPAIYWRNKQRCGTGRRRNGGIDDGWTESISRCHCRPRCAICGSVRSFRCPGGSHMVSASLNQISLFFCCITITRSPPLKLYVPIHRFWPYEFRRHMCHAPLSHESKAYDSIC